MDKEIKKLVTKLESQSWRVDDVGKGVMAYSPDGVTKVLIHKTESDHRAMKNTLARLRAGGFQP
jgi:hypothetical protein